MLVFLEILILMYLFIGGHLSVCILIFHIWLHTFTRNIMITRHRYRLIPWFLFLLINLIIQIIIQHFNLLLFFFFFKISSINIFLIDSLFLSNLLYTLYYIVISINIICEIHSFLNWIRHYHTRWCFIHFITFFWI